MARVLIVYGTTEGHTASISERMEGALRQAGHDVEVHDSKQLRKQEMAERFDAILVGGSVHAGELQSSVREFVKRNRGLLESVPSALFTVSLAAAESDAEALADSQSVIDKFVQETGWQPKQIERIAGALVYTQYNLFIRHLMKLIVKRQGRTELDTSQDYDFTDWDGVERFAREFAASLTA